MTERFSFNRETTMQRRDLRGGEQRARLAATPDGLLASIRWGDPHAGGSPPPPPPPTQCLVILGEMSVSFGC